MAKVLVIKLGYSETLDKEVATTTSLGDVLRTTVMLNFLKNDDVSWLVDEKAYPLLENNPYIRRILIFNLESILQLQHERFDTVINFEKGPGICALSDSINAWRRFGFRFESNTGTAHAYDGAEKVLGMCYDVNKKKQSHISWQDAMASMMGKSWTGKEEYILGYKARSKLLFDIGFNWVVGPKWPNKAWPEKHWRKLETLLEKKYSMSWQKGLTNLYEYMDWINSCRFIVTNDSLGLHLAIALKKKCVALFGPSASREVFCYGRGVKILPKVNYSCIPCLESHCRHKVSCMEFISPLQVKSEIVKLFPKR